MKQLIFIVCFVIGTVIAEDKWVWSDGERQINDRQDRKYSSSGTGDNSRRYNDDDDIRSRYAVTETEFKQPFPGGQENLGYNNFNTFGPGLSPPIPQRPSENLYPNPQKGILVGPGGPTGIIGRPRPGGIGGGGAGPAPFNPLKGHPANGILVGPGGPTGIIGRPSVHQGGQFPNNNFGNVGPHVFPPPQILQPNNFPPIVPPPAFSAYPTGIFPGGGIPPSSHAYPGGYPGEYPISDGYFPGQGNFPPNRDNFSPSRNRINVEATGFDDVQDRSFGKKLKNSDGTSNRNLLKKSVR